MLVASPQQFFYFARCSVAARPLLDGFGLVGHLVSRPVVPPNATRASARRGCYRPTSRLTIRSVISPAGAGRRSQCTPNFRIGRLPKDLLRDVALLGGLRLCTASPYRSYRRTPTLQAGQPAAWR